jgi:hypothetical protein
MQLFGAAESDDTSEGSPEKGDTTSPANIYQKLLLMVYIDAYLSNDSRFSKAQGSLGQDISSCDAVT